MVKFDEIQFNSALKRSLSDLKYIDATEVQARVIPEIIKGENIVCKSHTGSGKTLAFGIPISDRILNNLSKNVLIIGPTRELVVQVRTEISLLNKHSRLKVYNVYGGHGINDEVRQLRKGVDVLVATPGRLLDHIKRHVINPNLFDTVVLDEADRILDMGFITDIKQILKLVNPKNVHMFSATLEGKVARLIAEYIPKYKEITLPAEVVGTNITEKNVEVTKNDKYSTLLNVVKEAHGKKVLVFVSRKSYADVLCDKLSNDGFGVVAIHGDKTQNNREYSLKDFKSGRKQVLIATDVAARGLQVDDIEYVVNYDMARDKDTHKHRIGRTGRMGKTGIAINLIDSVPVNFDPRRSGSGGGGYRPHNRDSRSHRNDRSGGSHGGDRFGSKDSRDNKRPFNKRTSGPKRSFRDNRN